jgi:hypothetical protein
MPCYQAYVSITEAPARPSYRDGEPLLRSSRAYLLSSSNFDIPNYYSYHSPNSGFAPPALLYIFLCNHLCLFPELLLSRTIAVDSHVLTNLVSIPTPTVLTLPPLRRYSGTKACTRNCFDRAEVARVMDAAKRVREALPADIQAGLDQGLIAPDVLKDFFDLQSSPVMAFFTERFQGLRERW